MSTQNTRYNILEEDKVFELIISADDELREYFNRYLFDEYNNDLSSRLNYLDIAEISRFIVDKIKSKQADFVKDLFIKVEQILSDCDENVEDLIVVGLFESIQNIGGGRKIDYYRGFDKWLLLISKTKWDNLIDLWEGTSWRKQT
ncbi:MAG TPA: hypothetical protein VFE53_00215 [Mucilaginibacter sp.]|jgi:hypothetical protein|nr:hypothetical protein [Mucilaginibacter sp.]